MNLIKTLGVVFTLQSSYLLLADVNSGYFEKSWQEIYEMLKTEFSLPFYIKSELKITLTELHALRHGERSEATGAQRSSA